MAITIQHSPSAAAVGGVARQAGQGEFSKYMRQLIEQQNARQQQERMQQRSLGVQQSMQERGIQAQQTRDADYQQFQQDMKLLGFGMQEKQRKQKIADQVGLNLLGREIDQAYQQEEYVKNGWQNYVSGIKNWDDWNQDQMGQFQDIQNTMQSILGSKTFNQQEKEQMIQEGIMQLQGLQQGVIPTKKTQAAEWAEQGRGIGDTWIDENSGAMVTRTTSGDIKALVQPPKMADKSKMWDATVEELTSINPETQAEIKPSYGDVARLYAIKQKAFSGQELTEEEQQVMMQSSQQQPQAQQDQSQIREMLATPEGANRILMQMPLLSEKTGMTIEDLARMSDEEIIKLMDIEKQMRLKAVESQY